MSESEEEGDSEQRTENFNVKTVFAVFGCCFKLFLTLYTKGQINTERLAS